VSELTAYERIDAALVERGFGPIRDGLARCPAHDDRHPSLSVSRGRDRALVHCHAGCKPEAIVEGLGMSVADLFDQARTHGARNEHAEPRIVATYVYTDERGDPLFEVQRLEPKDFRQARIDAGGRRVTGKGCMDGVRLVPYHLPEVIAAVAADDPVYVCEGEKDADRVRAANCVATCNPAGAGKWREEFGAFFSRAADVRAADVRVIADRDEAGYKHAAEIASNLLAHGAVVRVFESAHGKDVSDHFDAGGSLEDLVEIDPTERASRCKREAHGDGGPSGALRFTTLSELFARSPDEAPDALVEGLLNLGSLAALVAKPKAGKSTLARALALAAATGQDFMGRPTRQGAVWYLALEDKPDEVARHLRLMGATSEEPIRFVFGPTPENAVAQLHDLAAIEKPALIVIDTLQRLARVRDLNDYAAVTLAFDPILQLARLSGACVLVLHHAKKGEGGWAGDNVLGSTAILGSVDTLISLRRTEHGRFLSTIQRYGEDLAEQVLELDTAGRPDLVGSRADHDLGRAETSVRSFLVGCAEPATETEIREGAKGTRRQIVGNALRALVAAGEVVRTGSGRKGDPFRYALQNARSHAPDISRERENENPNRDGTQRENEGNSRSQELPFEASAEESGERAFERAERPW